MASEIADPIDWQLVTPTIYKAILRAVTKENFLGVIVEMHFNWKDHISMVSQNNSKAWGIISRIRITLDIK